MTCDYIYIGNEELEEHNRNVHQLKDETRKSLPPSFICEVSTCGSSFYSSSKLSEHKQSQHCSPDQKHDADTFGKSPSSSPSIKKTAKIDDAISHNDDIENVEMMDTETGDILMMLEDLR